MTWWGALSAPGKVPLSGGYRMRVTGLGTDDGDPALNKWIDGSRTVVIENAPTATGWRLTIRQYEQNIPSPRPAVTDGEPRPVEVQVVY
jgi:hypothetical protein